MTQKQLAEILGCSQQFVSKWVNCSRGLRLTTALKWAKILDIDYEILILAPKKRSTRSKIIGLGKGK